jgi:cleavage and polyadenylation specificity factor subunit 2
LDGTLKVTLNSKVPLTGDELAAHLEEERLAKEREALHRAAEERSRRMLEADDLESDSDSDESGDEDAANALTSFDEKVGGDASTAMNGGMAGNAFLDSDDIRTTSFDIYVKGQQTRMTGFFRSGTAASGAPQARFRMFPFVERGGRGRKVDVFGETLDVGAWLRKGREIEEETESEEVREAKRRKKEEEEKKVRLYVDRSRRQVYSRHVPSQKEPPEPPSKFITEDLEVQLQCSIFFVDMEGLNDGRAIKTIIPSLNPRRMVRPLSAPDGRALV